MLSDDNAVILKCSLKTFERDEHTNKQKTFGVLISHFLPSSAIIITKGRTQVDGNYSVGAAVEGGKLFLIHLCKISCVTYVTYVRDVIDAIAPENDTPRT